MSTRIIKTTRFFSTELLNQYRQQMDPAADAVVSVVAEKGGAKGVRQLLLERTAGHIQLKDDPYCKDFYETHHQLPAWADQRQIDKACQLFQKNKDIVTLLLGCMSLPYTYLGADGVQVLMLSQRMQNDTRKRLEETGEFVFGILDESAWKGDSPEALERLLNVRLIHAAVRWFSLHSGKWNPAWGMPINQEDMVGTNLSFSYLVVLGLRKMNVHLDGKEEEFYLHFWKVAGFLSGVAEELLPINLREAYILSQQLSRHLFRSSTEGQLLTRALLQVMQEDIPEALKSLPAAQMRFLLGDEWADQLAVPAVPFEKKIIPWIPSGLFFKSQG
ncbi:oxygenase MpaB family protein [Siphonobacter sp. SORGH_AS_1065]|uniref:oxygenase MpaB family protein n=1 Tax=Siphonobacter sp. SORGH_AS_1065 TaxID=3041795 RepID=UPI00277E78F2|nr:oxygenase MpaB family protein [Siphonobacter sp. SORGH_AS_1065]MDQ1089151.1 hypothetical protein [Siphonobacter sp. SORGH_AS_1065]